MEASLYFHLPPLSRNHMRPEIISLSDDYDLKRVCGNSLEEETSPLGSLKALLSNVDKKVNRVEILMSLPNLTEEEIQAYWKEREHAKDYIQLHLKIDIYEPSDADMEAYLDLRDLPDAVEYEWMDSKVVGISSVLNIEIAIDAARIVIDDHLNGRVVLVGPEKRICKSFDDCEILLYECLFTRIGLRLPFSDFEKAILKHLKFAHSHLHSGSWAFMKLF